MLPSAQVVDVLRRCSTGDRAASDRLLAWIRLEIASRVGGSLERKTQPLALLILQTPLAGTTRAISRAAPKWRNWQTRRTQNPVPFGGVGSIPTFGIRPYRERGPAEAGPRVAGSGDGHRRQREGRLERHLEPCDARRVRRHQAGDRVRAVAGRVPFREGERRVRRQPADAVRRRRIRRATFRLLPCVSSPTIVSSPHGPAYAASSCSGWSFVVSPTVLAIGRAPTSRSTSQGSTPMICQPGAVVWKSRDMAL